MKINYLWKLLILGTKTVKEMQKSTFNGIVIDLTKHMMILVLVANCRMDVTKRLIYMYFIRDG